MRIAIHNTVIMCFIFIVSFYYFYIFALKLPNEFGASVRLPRFSFPNHRLQPVRPVQHDFEMTAYVRDFAGQTEFRSDFCIGASIPEKVLRAAGMKSPFLILFLDCHIHASSLPQRVLSLRVMIPDG
ncbi:MAG: hypothetical protein EG826_12890 [Deltaproteobacteria bacterium]|nr:hypothetical protein [Deltaproteobacteria bacterium]